MAPIKAKNYQCKMGFRGFETRNLGNLRQFFTMFEASRLKNSQCNCTGCNGALVDNQLLTLKYTFNNRRKILIPEHSIIMCHPVGYL